LGELLGRLDDLAFAVAVGRGHAFQNLSEGRHAVARLGRVIRAAVERLAVGREEHGHGPAAVPAEGLYGLHVDRVKVGPLLAVDFDTYEVGVHQLRGVFVFKGLMRHDMAPVTGSVTYT